MTWFLAVAGVAGVLFVTGLVVALWPDQRGREDAKLRHPSYQHHPIPYTLTGKDETP